MKKPTPPMRSRQTRTTPAKKGCARRFAVTACHRSFGLRDVELLIRDADPAMLLALFAMPVHYIASIGEMQALLHSPIYRPRSRAEKTEGRREHPVLLLRNSNGCPRFRIAE